MIHRQFGIFLRLLCHNVIDIDIQKDHQHNGNQQQEQVSLNFGAVFPFGQRL